MTGDNQIAFFKYNMPLTLEKTTHRWSIPQVRYCLDINLSVWCSITIKTNMHN
uniref:Uncharacterized protein n=1 Tax=Siphoviridae sp. ctorp6 TaxID=2825673 RepID=A0A8S5PDU8_9CAUD|nr:MAG TPA: hypothetical protein [Siphoviridae sp. ctorp6]